ncbi:hypothetical protein [Coleofasciculus sp. FACHB-501]|nr:hypothetical protein [Coleofasciculus sp. FACHB-501]
MRKRSDRILGEMDAIAISADVSARLGMIRAISFLINFVGNYSASSAQQT